uniref:Small auxin up regulated protein n=1 Tax=Boehmeria nivea TaxID=83906 RepID=A0A172J1Z9_BOENI|nr:small auxin up regulated protein [Boehmeria nivea]
MARVGKLTKLKSAIKRLPSFTKFARTPSGSDLYEPARNDAVAACSKVSSDVVLRAVCVGKSRRRYLVPSEIVDHPLFQDLVDKSRTATKNDSDDENDNDNGSYDDGVVFVACEVVMFEHLLWMLHNAEAAQLAGPTDELVDFYTC